jgi:hypothetical protein
MASAVIGALRVDLGINSAQFATQLKQTQAQINTFAASAQKSFAGLAGGIRTLSVVASAVMGGSFLFAIKKGIDAAGEIDDAAQRIGISAEKFQELAYAAKLAGVEQKDFATAMEQLTRRLGEVNLKGTAAETALKKLGLGLKDIRGQSPDKALGLIADRLKQIQDPMQRNAILADLFGRAGIKMAIMLKDGAAGLAELAKEARALGFVVSNEVIERAAKAGDEIDRLALASRAAGIQMGAGFLPALEAIRRVVTSQDFQNGIKTVAENMGQFVRFLVDNKDEILAVTAAFITFSKVTAATKNPWLGLAAGAAAGIAAGEAMRGELEKTERELERLERQAARLRTTLTMQPPVAGAAGAGMWDTQNRLIQTQADIDKTKKKLEELRKAATERTEPTKPARPQIDVVQSANLKAIEEITNEIQFKAALARGEFSQFAPGFIEAARAAGIFGKEVANIPRDLSKMAPEMQKLNIEFEKLKNAEQLKSIAKGIGDALGSAFESAIVDAKSFQEVIRALYKDLLRLFIRKLITEPLGNFLTAGLGNFGIPGRAMGGPVMAGQMYEVGERGRELFIPNTDGRIIPHNQLNQIGRGGGLTYAPVIDMRGADQAAVARMEMILRDHSRQLANQQRGMLSAQHFSNTGVLR